MDTFAKSDLFFFITGAAVIVVTLVLLVALVYIIRILRNVNDISDRVRQESALIQEDIHAARSRAKSAGLAAALFGFIKSLYKRSKK
jgi:hypothetical protein